MHDLKMKIMNFQIVCELQKSLKKHSPLDSRRMKLMAEMVSIAFHHRILITRRRIFEREIRAPFRFLAKFRIHG